MQLGTLSHSRAAQASLPSLCPLWPQVHEDYACTLNQTNIGSNNNKFYIIQLLEEGDRFACWNRWGRVVSATFPPCAHLLPTSLFTIHAPYSPRVPTTYSAADHTPSPLLTTQGLLAQQRATNVHSGYCRRHTPEGCWLQGEVGQSKLSYFVLLEDAKKDFEKKFRDKTKNSWVDRDHFVAHPGKYMLIEVRGEDEAQEAMVKVKWPGRVVGLALREGTRWRNPASCVLPLSSLVASGIDLSSLASTWPVSV